MAVMFNNSNSSKYKSYSGSTSKKKKKKENPLVFKTTSTTTGTGSSSSGNSTADTLDSLSGQITNYKTRTEAIGADGVDTRNPLEKLLNLPEDQNFLFDIGEILDRPFNAIKGGIQEAQEGGSFLEGLGQGISGEQQYYAGDILRNAGVSDEVLFTNPLNGEDVSLADILGLGADIFADPTTYLSAGVGAAAKGAKIANTASKLAKATKAVDTASDTLTTLQKTVGNLDNLSDAERALNSIQLNRATNALADAQRTKAFAQDAADFAKNMATPKMSLQDLAVSGLVGGVKKGASVADKIITRGLDSLDNRTLRNMVKGGATSKDLSKFTSSLDMYRDAKNTVRNLTNYGKSLPGNIVNSLRNTDRTTDAINTKTANEISDMRKSIDNYVKNGIAKKGDNFTFKDSKEVETAIQEVYSRINKKQTTNMYDFFRDAANSNRKTAIITGNYKDLQKVADDINNATINGKQIGRQVKLTVSNDNGVGKLTISGIKNRSRTDLKDIVNNEDLSNYLKGIDVRTPRNIRNTEALDTLNKNVDSYVKALNEDSDFKNIYDRALKIGQDYVDNMSKATGKKVDFNEIWSKEPYLPKGLAEPTKSSRNHAFDKAEYGDVSAGVANIAAREKYEDVASGIQNKIDTADKKLSGNRQQAIGEQLATKKTELNERKQISKAINDLEVNKVSTNDLDYLKSSLSEKGNSVLNKAINIKDKQFKNNELIKAKDEALSDYQKYVSADVMNKVTNITDTKIAKTYLDTAKKYNNALRDARDLSKEMLKAAKQGRGIKNRIKSLNNCYKKATKYKRSLDTQIAKINGSLTKDMTKKLEKTVNKTVSVTKGKAKLMSRGGRLDDKFEQVKNSNEAIISNLEDQINRLTIQYENWNPALEKNIKADKEITDSISGLKRQLDYVSTKAGKDLFSTSYFDGLTSFMERSSKANKDLVGYSKILLEAGLNDKSIVRFIDKNTSVKKVTGMKRLSKEDTQNFINYLNNNKNLLSDDLAGNLETFKSQLKNSDGIFIDKTAYEMLTRNVFTEKSTNSFVGGLNKVNDMFKTLSTTSVGFHLRNMFGNYSNMVLSGMPIHSAVSEIANANRILKKDYMWDLLAHGAKNAKQADDLKLINQFIDAGFLGQGKEVRDLQNLVERYGDVEKYKNTFSKTFGKIFDANMKLNEFTDSRTRMAILSYANKHPDYVSKLGVRNPVESVKLVAMDPSNMSPFEKNVMKKIIPFYTFTKQNLYFQASNILKNPSKYKELVKAFDLTYDSLDEDQYRDYQKSGMQIPVYTDEEGNTTVLKTNLPASDLGDWVEDPLRKLVSSASPLISTPYEMVTGVDTFTGNESNKSGLNYLTEALGLSNLTKIPSRISDLSSDNTTSQNLSNIFGSVASYNDSDKIAINNAYDELEEYQNYIDELKSQGINVPTLQELEEQGIDVDAIKEQVSQDDSLLRRIKRRREQLQKSLGI